jgi:hypothetical protein
MGKHKWTRVVSGHDPSNIWLTREKASATISTDSVDGNAPASQWRVIRVPVIDRSFPETGVVQLEATILHSFEGDADEAADVLAEAMLRGARACREAMRERGAWSGGGGGAGVQTPHLLITSIRPFAQRQDVTEAAARVCEDPRGH